ncbi:hypothetical protein [Nocardiopsis synnemataformans]|uniref:hypothetical protein n=1 Tax=Nocardiopsis synnemataformans TaxID=61305 RepID=UPI003EBA19D8
MASLTPDQTEALAELDAATERYRAAERAYVEAREHVHGKIVRALQAGIGTSEVGRHAPYDRNHVNRIRKDAGIPSKR